MKTSLLRLIVPLAAWVLTTSAALGVARIAGGDLTFQASGTVSYSDRINGNALSPSDIFFTLTPALNYTRDAGRISIKSTLSLPVIRYADETSNNSEDIRFSLNGNIPYAPGARISGSWNLNYYDAAEVDYFVNQRVNRESFSFGANSNIALGRRFSLRGGLSFSDNSNSLFSDTETFSYYAGVQANELLGRVGMYLDYRIQERKATSGPVNQGIDDDDDSIVFGLTGQVLPERLFPKLEADLSIGYQKTDSPSDPSDGRETVTLNGSLRYPATAKTDVVFSLNRNIAVAATDQNVEASNASLTLSHRFRQNLSGTSSIGYTWNDFIGVTRSDENLYLSAGLTYSLVQYWSFSTNVSYRDNSSNIEFADFSSTTISLSATFSY